MDPTILTCVFAILIGLIPGAIASNKGHSFLGWWIFGAALFIVALPMALVLKPNTKELERNQLSTGEIKKCPYCAELIKTEARVCRYCGNQLLSGQSQTFSTSTSINNYRFVPNADLSGYDLTRTNLSEANLTEADLSMADLTKANLTNSNLKGTNLVRTDLTGAIVFGADFSGAKYDKDTKWPNGFDPVTAGAILVIQ